MLKTGYEYRDRQMQMVGGNGGNQFRQYVGQNVGNQNRYNAVQNVKNQNPNRNGNVVETRAEDKEIRNNNNQIRKMQEIQLQAKEFDLIAAAGDLDEIEELSKEKSIVYSLQEEKNKLKSDFKLRKDELLDKQIQLEKKIKELDNILIKTGQSIQTIHMLSPKPDSFYHTEQKMALGYQNPFYLKQAQQKQQSLYNGKVLLEKHDPPAVYDSEETLELAQESCLKVSEQKDTTKGTSVNTQFRKQSILGKPPSSSGSKLYLVSPFPKSKGLPKIDEAHALSKPVTSNSVPTPQESKVVKNDNVIA
ncbi:hypothetical protein Tco_0806397 [Tanacetum coccineum]